MVSCFACPSDEREVLKPRILVSEPNKKVPVAPRQILVSPIEIRKIVIMAEGGEQAFFIGIPKTWFMDWGEPVEIGVRYEKTKKDEDKILFIHAVTDSSTEIVKLKPRDHSFYFRVDKSFLEGVPQSAKVILHKYGSYAEILIPNKIMPDNELTYRMKLRDLTPVQYRQSLSNLI